MIALDDIIKNLYTDGFSRDDIVNIINDDPNLPNTNYDHVKYVIRTKVVLNDVPKEEKKRGPPIDDSIPSKIREALDECPSASIRQIAYMIGSNHGTVYRYLTHVMNYKFRSIKWIPHCLDAGTKIKRVTYSKRLLKILKTKKKKIVLNFYIPVMSHGFFMIMIATNCGCPVMLTV